MLFKKKTNYKNIDRSTNWIEEKPDIGRNEKRRNLFFWRRKNRYNKMHRNELTQKKAANAARKNKED